MSFQASSRVRKRSRALVIRDLSSHPLNPDLNIPFPLPRPPFRLLIVAPSGTGKSNLIRNMLTRPEFGYAKVFGKNIWVVSPTKDLDDMLDFIPDSHKSYHFSEEFIQNMLGVQRTVTHRREHDQREGKHNLGRHYGTTHRAVMEYLIDGTDGRRVNPREYELREQRRQRRRNKDIRNKRRRTATTPAGLSRFDGTASRTGQATESDSSDPEKTPNEYEHVVDASDDSDGEHKQQPRRRSRTTKKTMKLLIMDDVIGTGALRTDSNNVVNQLFCSGRHHGLSLILVSQKYKAVPDICRSNASQTILMHGIPPYQLRKAAEEQSISPNQFMHVYNYATSEPYSFVYIDFTKHPSVRYFKNFTEQIHTPNQTIIADDDLVGNPDDFESPYV